MTYELKLSVKEAKRLIAPVIYFGASNIDDKLSFREHTEDFLTTSGFGFTMKFRVYRLDRCDEMDKMMSFPGSRLSYIDRLYLNYESIHLIFDDENIALLFKMSCL